MKSLNESRLKSQADNRIYLRRGRGLPSLSVSVLALLMVTLTAAAGADTLPAYRGYVNDFGGVFTSPEASRLNQTIQAINRASGVEIALVTVPTIYPYPAIEEYSMALAEAWGVGRGDRDNGMILLLAMEERRIRIEVGYGLEGAFPDGMVGSIMDKSMVPHFQRGDFGTGFQKALEGIAGVIEKEYDVKISAVSTRESEQYYSRRGSESGELFFVIFIFFIFVTGGRFFWPLLFLGRLSGRRRYYRGGFGSGGFGSFGSGGSSFRGGGFSGFGGGGFGGGGASRGF